MLQIRLKAHARVVPQDRLVFTEAAKLGEVDAREAYLNLIMDAEIIVDKAELAQVAKVPEVAQALQQVQAPQRPEYKPQDWRAKQVVIRDIQWQRKPVIEYIAQNYKNDVIEAVSANIDVPADWKKELFAKTSYRLEPQALQLSSPDEKDKNWKSVFVQVIMDLGDSESGFLGKLSSEFDVAESSGKLQQAEEMMSFQSSLTGFDSALRHLDPYAGAKLSGTKIKGWDVADEPGYDKEIRSAFYDHFSDVVGGKVSKIDDAGRVYFTPQKYEEHEPAPEPVPRSQREATPKPEAETEPETTEEGIDPHIQYISEMMGIPVDPGMPGVAEPPLDPPDEPEEMMCETCKGAGCEDCEFSGMVAPLSPQDISDIRTQEKLDQYYGK
jgi:hypothetical protein